MSASLGVVIPTYNRSRELRRCLRALEAQSAGAGAFEVVVVDDGSHDDTWEVLKEIQRGTPLALRALHRSHRGPAAARNAGWQECEAEIVAFTDDDCAAEPDWIAAIGRAARLADRHGFGGPLPALPSSRWVAHYLGRIGGHQAVTTSAGEVDWVNTANAAFRRHALVAVGGFDEDFDRPGGEEIDLCRRLRRGGFRLAMVADMVVRYAHRETFAGMLATAFRYGRGQRKVARKNGQGPEESRREAGADDGRGSTRRRLAGLPPGTRALYRLCEIGRHGAYRLGHLAERMTERVAAAAPASGRR